MPNLISQIVATRFGSFHAAASQCDIGNVSHEIFCPIVNQNCAWVAHLYEMAPPLTEEYIDLSETTRAKYGERSLVFLQCGGFYEAYDVSDASVSRPLGICERELYLKVVKRSNGVYAAGVPLESLARYRTMLLEKGYTVVIVDQVDGTERQVTAIVSPGFDDDANESAAGAILIVDACAHVARYDVQTNRLDMRVAKANTALQAIEAARQCLYETGRCTEIEVHLDTTERLDDGDIAARFPQTALHVRDVRALGRRRYVYNEAWQRRCLESHFGRHVAFGACIFEKLGLRDASPASVAALIFLVNFVRDHNPAMLNIIPVPNRSLEDDCEVKLLHGVVDTLNVMQGNVTIFGILGEDVRTQMGDAALRARLCRPTSDVDVLTARYDEIETMQAWRREMADDDSRLDAALRGARNLAKLACRTRRGILRIHEVAALIETHRCAKEALLIGSMVLRSTAEEDSIAALTDALAVCDARFDVEGEYGIARDDDGEVHRKRRVCKDAMTTVNSIKTAIDTASTHTTRSGALVRLVGGPSSGYQLQTTPSRAKALQKHGYTFATVNATTVRVTNPEVGAALDALATARCEFDECCTTVFETTCAALNRDYFSLHADAIARAVGELDAVRSLSAVASRYRFCRPSLDGERAGGAFSANALRHPIIEKLVDARGCTYVSNDVLLHSDHSILLYGVNSVGKSSLLKAAACAVLMAQSGSFVAATECTVAPYRAIAMHIGGADDMYRAQSSFVREVEQLRTVLRASRTYGPRVLFFADELGNTTEDTSATKLVASLLHTLYTRGASLFVATHMFALQENAVVSGLVGLRNHHLAVEFTDNGGVCFDRTLKTGLPPVREYGCRIAEHLIVDDPAFVTLLRSERHNGAADRFDRMRRPSRYNRHLFAEACSVCEYRPQNERELPIAWHHIEGQCTASDGVVPSGRNVHASSNLMPVCQACHQDIHRGLITVRGYVETGVGRELRFERTQTCVPCDL